MNMQVLINMRPLGKKGVSGKVLTIVASLVIGIAALILLWLFLTGMMPVATKAVEDLITGFKRMICQKMPWPASEVCKWGLGT